MTDEQLAAIRARADATTPGEWIADDIEPWFVFETTFNGEIAEALIRTKRRADATFIAHARQDVPALLAEVEWLRSRQAVLIEQFPAMFGDALAADPRIVAMGEIVEAVASVDDAEILDACPHCRAEQDYTTLTHTPTCPVTKARALLDISSDHETTP